MVLSQHTQKRSHKNTAFHDDEMLCFEILRYERSIDFRSHLYRHGRLHQGQLQSQPIN